ncbi:S8 family serine peptidase [Phenylobacterium sp.]|uniref:S8 family serine peptidase n=1 Tax=Phenylobacterium sp. TaxID=1871053 RepID=UPI003D2C79A1
MADRRRVLIHVMRETDGGRAADLLGVRPQYDGGPIVQGEGDEELIARLRGENFVVEELPDPPADISLADPGIYRSTARYRWSAGQPPHMPGGAIPSTPTERPMSAFTVSMREGAASIGDILGAGGRLTRALPGGLFVADLSAAASAVLAGDPRVDIAPFNVSPAFAPAQPLSSDAAAAVAPETGQVREFDIVAHSPDRVTEIEAWVAAKGGALERVGAGERKVRIRVADDSPLVDEANQLDGVFDVAVVPEARFCLDLVPSLVGLPAAGVTAGLPALDGAGQVLGMTDGAVDTTHADFGARVSAAPGGAQPSAHGTHVAGIMVGDGAQSQGNFRGIAPAAQLVAEALTVQPNGVLLLPLDLGLSLRNSYAAGVRIHNLSFAEDNGRSLYSVRANELDAFAVDHPDMLVVVAAGNAGRSETAVWRGNGWIDLQSVASPGVAKNVLTVGACCSSRTGGGHAAADWAAFDPQTFVSMPTALEPLSGIGDAIAAFSGRGWGHGTDRIKPDLVAPGTNIVAARANGPDTLWGVHSADYLYSGGTSMAAPVAAGCAALIRQRYVQLGHLAPTSALLKATLAAGADWLSQPSAAGSPPSSPPATPCANVDQGFGRINVARSLALDGLGRSLLYVDLTKSGQVAGVVANGSFPTPFRKDGDRARFWFNATGGSQPIDIALCFTDPVPGPAGVALNLMVQPRNGAVRTGNDRAVKSMYPNGPTPDRANNLQVVRLDPMTGRIDIQVSALALQGYNVGFALVVLAETGGGQLYRMI